MLSDPSPNFRSSLKAPCPRDSYEASTPCRLIERGWTFAAEPAVDGSWRVSASHAGEMLMTASAPRLGDAFLEVEQKAHQREAELRSPARRIDDPSEGPASRLRRAP